MALDSTLPLRSCTVVAALPFAARDEPPAHQGITHLLEHVIMAVESPSDNQVFSSWVTGCGGQSNAFTAKEFLAFWGRVPQEFAAECCIRLLDAVYHPVITESVLKREQAVVRQELATARADPSDQVVEKFYAALFPSHALGRSVGGEPDVISSLSVADLEAHLDASLASSPLCVSLVGPPDALKSSEGMIRSREYRRTETRTSFARRAPIQPPLPPNLDCAETSDFAYVAMGGRAGVRGSGSAHAATVLAALIGGMPGSILYRAIRDERALSYDFYSHASTFSDSGAWRTVLGLAPSNVTAASEVVFNCLQHVAHRQVPADMVDWAKRQAVGAVTIDNEDPVLRADLNLRALTWAPKTVVPSEEVRSRLSRVSLEALSEAAKGVVDSYTAVAAI